MSFLTRWQHRRTQQAPLDTPTRTFVGLTLFAKVESVYDGDTITVITRLPREPFHSYKFRLAGLDTPELRVSRGDPDRVAHKAAGLEVKRRLEAKIPVGTVVIIECTAEDKYGRLLGDIHLTRASPGRGWRKTESVNQWLVDNHLALAYDGGKKQEFTPDFFQRILEAGGVRVTAV